MQQTFHFAIKPFRTQPRDRAVIAASLALIAVWSVWTMQTIAARDRMPPVMAQFRGPHG